jgi:hypothetical protein
MLGPRMGSKHALAGCGITGMGSIALERAKRFSTLNDASRMQATLLRFSDGRNYPDLLPPRTVTRPGSPQAPA